MASYRYSQSLAVGFWQLTFGKRLFDGLTQPCSQLRQAPPPFFNHLLSSFLGLLIIRCVEDISYSDMNLRANLHYDPKHDVKSNRHKLSEYLGKCLSKDLQRLIDLLLSYNEGWDETNSVVPWAAGEQQKLPF
jgi:hypothetical protein